MTPHPETCQHGKGPHAFHTPQRYEVLELGALSLHLA
jgi:hypothetical protein